MNVLDVCFRIFVYKYMLHKLKVLTFAGLANFLSDEDHLVSQKLAASLSVSELSEFYFYDCEKFLKLKSRQNHDEKNAKITKGPKPQRDNKAKVGQIFCQMSFKVNETFYEKFNLKGIIEIKDFRPDFIKVNKKSYEIRDAKSSKCVQSSHKVKISNTCGIYLPPFNLQQISIKELLPEIKDLFRERLPRIIETSIQNSSWHFDSSCKNCYFVHNCKKEVKGTLALITNLSRKQLINIKRDLETEESGMNVELVNDVDIEDLIIKYEISPYMEMKSVQAQGICLYARDKKIKQKFRQSKSLSKDEDLNKNHEELPARNTREFPRLIVLEQSIRENVAICVPGFYCITDIWEQLVVPKMHDQVLLRSLKPHVKHIDFECIFTFWHSAGPKQVNKFQLLRIDFGYAVIEAYYELLKESINDNSTSKLIFDAPEFTLASTKTFKNNYLGKLYYFKLLEARAECKDKKSQRMSDYLQNESAYGIKIQFEKFININSDRVTLFTTLSNEQELESDRHYKQFMLVEDSPEGILEAIRFSDLTHMDDQEVHFEQKSTFLCVLKLDLLNRKVYLTGIIDMLIEIDNRGVKSVFMDLLINTNNWCEEELLEGRLKIVSGPASSDKVASLIMRHLSQPIDQNRNYIIGVTALSREAIQNLLKVFLTLPTKIKIPGGNLIVIGGTVWDWYKLRKAWNRWPGCDIMLIDEGSQAISDASIAIECLKPKTGKLIIAGDSELKPYIRNKFPNDHPFLFGSIQQCLNSLKMRNNKH
ncbi:1569_t:CDS:10 [Funneliformis mosseae]|uniref:1569_t:CDS:1 n=1 Tax=Funneliformis mosseae TaxID=27381 RepID=A0A9N9B2C6_FUNMO|nr:1569_t:CDS:10 [Funneliformis mosseae]